MNSITIIGINLIIGAAIISGAVVISDQQADSENKIQVYKEKIYDSEWNEEITKILPRGGELGKDWNLLWSDSSKEFIKGENPVIIKKTVAGNEILSTSYTYSYKNNETYQIFIWKGELVSNWISKDAVNNIFLQIDAKTEKIIDGLDLIPNCVVGYYDYYGEENEIENDLLFSECAKKDVRIRVNLIEGHYSQESIEKIVFLSNLATGKI
ncbi:hypothetical protein C5F47_03705 [Nitrosopumilus cobalaminigenes]|uniref:Uncharacterized protein n=1 Tax=Nitrosopumilus cobalaminigenes TaxID=1470066 RepID=A0A7D5R6E2_9ARCH|nr:hypothetical protein [Nitrosopumilus cobalaminigenes]QLH02722.1 hypothetical protein C5F47_03705 [Nitrosopumilus cobalaminigenes]